MTSRETDRLAHFNKARGGGCPLGRRAARRPASCTHASHVLLCPLGPPVPPTHTAQIASDPTYDPHAAMCSNAAIYLDSFFQASAGCAAGMQRWCGAAAPVPPGAAPSANKTPAASACLPHAAPCPLRARRCALQFMDDSGLGFQWLIDTIASYANVPAPSSDDAEIQQWCGGGGLPLNGRLLLLLLCWMRLLAAPWRARAGSAALSTAAPALQLARQLLRCPAACVLHPLPAGSSSRRVWPART